MLEDVVVIPFNDADRAVAILSAQAGQLAGVLIDAMPNRVGMVPAMIGQFVAIGTRWRPKRRDVGSKRCSWR